MDYPSARLRTSCGKLFRAQLVRQIAQMALFPLDKWRNCGIFGLVVIPRKLSGVVMEKLTSSDKGVFIYGARQVGKTTLVNEVIGKLGVRTLVINGDQSRYVSVLSSRDLARIRGLVAGYELLFVDEAQRIPEIGLNLKIIRDELPKLKLVVTGSSSLDLASRISEPLTGRMWTYRLYPIAVSELGGLYNDFELGSALEERLVYGSYPEIFSMDGGSQKREYLQVLADAYLYKDLLELGGLKSSAKIRDLLKLLAFQIGSEVSLSELGTTLEMSKDTVSRYIDFLEKSYVVFRVSGLSRNLRKEVGKMDKIFFYDLGVRNSMIDNFKTLKDRDDAGRLWENWLIVERMKKLAYTGEYPAMYFWRTYTGAELDYVEEGGGKLAGYEFKYSRKGTRAPKSWLETYPGSSFSVVNKDNWLEFVR